MLVPVGWLNAASTRGPQWPSGTNPAGGSGHLVIGQGMADHPVGSASLDLRVASSLLGEGKPDVCQDAPGVGRGQKVELPEGSHADSG